MSDVLGRTSSLTEAAETILREVSAVIHARRASIMVYDERLDALRLVASRGFDSDGLAPVPIDSPDSVAARVYRDQCVITAVSPRGARGGYSATSYLSVPIRYAAPGSPERCVGVISFTDREGEDRFSESDRRLVTTVANLIGVAIENARLVARERTGQRVRRELELASDLQLRLLPSPAVLHGDAVVAARCVQAEWVGGDFYTWSRLGRGRVGVMLGDVSSHGFSAALVMALVVSAGGIHAGAAFTPDETLSAMLESLAPELVRTEMYLTVFYGVLDPSRSSLMYASAGHPHAFRVSASGFERLWATAPPLGLAAGAIESRRVAWSRDDLLCLWTDGMEDVKSASGEPFGEARVLEALMRYCTEPPETIVDRVMAEVERFASGHGDDRTLLVLRL